MARLLSLLVRSRAWVHLSLPVEPVVKTKCSYHAGTSEAIVALKREGEVVAEEEEVGVAVAAGKVLAGVAVKPERHQGK